MIRLSIVIVLASTGIASARDSTWLLCRGTTKDRTHVVASVHEHRAPNGSDRDVAVTLIYGDHVAKGTIAADSLKLSALEGKPVVVFTGKAALATNMRTLAFDGSIDWTFGGAKPVPVTAKLTCEAIDD